MFGPQFNRTAAPRHALAFIVSALKSPVMSHRHSGHLPCHWNGFNMSTSTSLAHFHEPDLTAIAAPPLTVTLDGLRYGRSKGLPQKTSPRPSFPARVPASAHLVASQPIKDGISNHSSSGSLGSPPGSSVHGPPATTLAPTG